MTRKINFEKLNRVIKCPHCDNEEILGDICHVCNLPTVNKCSGFDKKYLQDIYDGPWLTFEKSCGKILPTNARYCYSCNSTSTFIECGHLVHHEEEMEYLKGLDANKERTPLNRDDYNELSSIGLIGNQNY
ncbi:hypothetical protein CR203_03320 [Salipaludibacillus neizhouensis]|uniref:Uncharacterized protein n=1 Tax=Salipaludibacillus neizhouensis TaxID=885475 RepID=A0A3A9KMG8_9BACI|nr:hypothetical protein [Salipaludibacillus neizhouensis]RKL69085.1 hypothetical protein CR203_03320 [Salipaludibacillus neizhouensis]